MKDSVQALMIMLGQAPTKPRQISEAAQALYAKKREQKKDVAFLKREYQAVREGNYHKPWRRRRWIVLIGINMVFTVSFWLEVPLFKGSLIASQVLGFHMAEVYSTLQVALAYGKVSVNLMIGVVTALICWVILGGRAFCSWVCPYHLLAEGAEQVHLQLLAKRWVSDHLFHRSVRPVFLIVFAVLAWWLSYGVFMSVNPVGIVSRALIYGPSVALLWVGVLLVFEVFYSRRAWCRYVCPVGLTYGVVGLFSPIGVTYHLAACQHEGACRTVCEVPHVLECIKKGRAADVTVSIGADCTLCGACVDACPTQSLRFEVCGVSHDRV